MSATTNYPELAKHISKNMGKMAKSKPGLLKGFRELHSASLEPGALDLKTKELIALSIAIATRCEGCIAFHMNNALKNNATEEEIMETLGVAVMMGGGPSMMYASLAVSALEQFQELD